jgi:hypothetical protein
VPQKCHGTASSVNRSRFASFSRKIKLGFVSPCHAGEGWATKLATAK